MNNNYIDIKNLLTDGHKYYIYDPTNINNAYGYELFYGIAINNNFFKEHNHLSYFKNGVLHRIDGPAIECYNCIISKWFYNGKQIFCNSLKEFKKLIKLIIFE